MELYASGHNAWNQLHFRDHDHDSAPSPQDSSSSCSPEHHRHDRPPPSRPKYRGEGLRGADQEQEQEQEPCDFRRFVCVLADCGARENEAGVLGWIEVLRADRSSTLGKGFLRWVVVVTFYAYFSLEWNKAPFPEILWSFFSFGL
jgi:hypothetical protein